MAKLNFASAFELTLDNGEKKTFKAGLQNVPEELVDHWFVQAHVAPDDDEDDDGGEGDDADKAVLIAMAQELGIKANKRWSNSKIEAAIEEAEAKKKAENGGGE